MLKTWVRTVICHAQSGDGAASKVGIRRADSHSRSGRASGVEARGSATQD